MAASHSIRHHSLSPPLQSQYNTSSKRDRKRTHLETRVKDIAANLTAHRDVNLRTQLNSIQRDIAFITRAELYTGKRLNDHPEDLVTEVPNVNAMGMVVDAETAKLPLGKHAASFIEHVNNAMDERDGNIANVQRQFLHRLQNFKREHDFSVEVALTEEQALKDAAKIRVMNALQARKKALQRDKEMLDFADTNAMLHGAGMMLNTPGSPGPHSNRKTRQGRQTRQDQDNYETVDGTSKRKRKHDYEESPNPATRNLLAQTPWSRDTVSATGDTDIAKYFTPKDLAAHQRQAHQTVAESWIERKPLHANGTTKSHLTNGHHETNSRYNNGAHHESGDSDSLPDASTLVAPAMDRTGSHATRSTRNNQTDITSARDAMEALKNPERIYGMAVLEALAPRQSKAAKGDQEAPWTTSLTMAEILEDRAYLESL